MKKATGVVIIIAALLTSACNASELGIGLLYALGNGSYISITDPGGPDPGDCGHTWDYFDPDCPEYIGP